jgi:hypothetical protein
MAKRRAKKSNWQFDSQPLKVENCSNFTYVKVACHILLEISQHMI